MTVQPLPPFGVLVARRDAPPPALVRDLVARDRVVVVRGCAIADADALTAFARGLGEPLEWSFGAVNELTPHERPVNYLYSERAVPFHWDGAFVGRIPSLIVFHCIAAPADGDGGETLFADTTRLLARAPTSARERWRGVRIAYRTEKIAHYGGEFTAPLIAEHPLTGEAVVRYAEPVDDLNPVRLEVAGDDDPTGLIADLATRLRDPAVCYAHAWRAGDLLIADNHALLHGRNAFAASARRHLRRVNVL